ncbi:MAG: hypothetical protein J3R72DRAFT_423737 [Linnemannia gamsii]|nr:MAG: hypothetical protein J3R72DRAFT_423737 [Linnemannia gamsii]
MDLDPKESDWDFDQRPLTLRQEPLHHLKAIELSTMDILGDNLALILCSILKHWATLEKLKLPSLRDSTNIQAVSKTIDDHCPYITNLCTSPPNGQETFMCIMKRLPEQQLQTLQATDIFDESSSALSSTVFARHSETLHTIVFPAPQILKSTTLQAILTFCRALEVLKAHDDYSIYNTLAIEDAVATEIRHLEIAVEFTPDGSDPGYLADPTKTSWKNQDHEHWGMLDKFYTQIGNLENLELLHIKSAKANLPFDEEEDDEYEGIPYSATCLPGLLALEDEATGQIGFLSRWDGLTSYKTSADPSW